MLSYFYQTLLSPYANILHAAPGKFVFVQLRNSLLSSKSADDQV